MKSKTIKREGWKITHDDDKFYLTIMPNVISELGACYLVDKRVYKQALNDEVELSKLIIDFDIISSFRKVYDLRKPEKIIIQPNTSTRYNNGDFIVTAERDGSIASVKNGTIFSR